MTAIKAQLTFWSRSPLSRISRFEWTLYASLVFWGIVAIGTSDPVGSKLFLEEFAGYTDVSTTPAPIGFGCRHWYQVSRTSFSGVDANGNHSEGLVCSTVTGELSVQVLANRVAQADLF